MEKIIHFWKAGMEGAKTLQNEQRFNEALKRLSKVASSSIQPRSMAMDEQKGLWRRPLKHGESM